MGLLTGYALGKVDDRFIEITLTTVLAYVSYLVAEEGLHVSGVMATIAAGLTIGGWGRVKISPAVRHYLESFWEYVAFIANALIFLLVGLRVEPFSLGQHWARCSGWWSPCWCRAPSSSTASCRSSNDCPGRSR